MTPDYIKRILDSKSPTRPSYAAGVKRQVIARDTPLGFEHPTCYFCKATVLPDELTLHHEPPWALTKDRLAHDYDFQIADPEMQAQTVSEMYNDPETLHVAHKPCNSADGYPVRDWEASRRHAQRVKEEPGRWRF